MSADHLSNISHVFWDLDHTLWDYVTNARITIFELFEKHGISHQIEHSPAVFHEIYCKHNDLAWEDYRNGIIDKEILRQRRFRDTFLELGANPKDISDIFEKEFVEICPTKPNLLPGALEVLNKYQAFYSQHIITNGFKETQHIKMKHSGIGHFFKSITHSEETGYQKPSPEIFKIAINTAGASIENSLMIGDNFEADILGALNMGMKCIYFNPHQKDLPIKDPKILNISSLKELI